MDLYEVADQIVKLLQQRGRLTYRVLKLQFKLDDEMLEALKDELLFAHPVVDQDGRGLIWAGDAGQENPSSPNQSSLPQTKNANLRHTRPNTWPRKSSPAAAPWKANANRSL